MGATRGLPHLTRALESTLAGMQQSSHRARVLALAAYLSPAPASGSRVLRCFTLLLLMQDDETRSGDYAISSFALLWLDCFRAMLQ
jgi:hypothetical protein